MILIKTYISKREHTILSKHLDWNQLPQQPKNDITRLSTPNVIRIQSALNPAFSGNSEA